MEVGHDGVRHGELVGREDELVGPGVVGAHLVVRGHVGLQGPDHGHAHAADLVAAALGAVDLGGRLLADDDAFAVHAVLGEVLDVHRAEVADAHVHGDEGLLDVVEDHPVEQLAAEMEAGRRGGHGSLVLGEDGLELLGVLGRRGLLDPLRHRGLAQREERGLELLVRSVIEEAQRAAAGGRVVDHLGHHALVLSEIQFVADPDLAGGIHDHVPEALLLVEFAQQEHHDVGARLLLLAGKLGREDLGVVEDEPVTLAEIVDDVLELPVVDLAGVLVEDHQFAFVAPLDVSVDDGHQLRGDLLLREFEVEL